MRPTRSQMQPFARHWPSGRPTVTSLLLVASMAAAGAQWSLALFDRGEAEAPFRLVENLGLHSTALADGSWWQFFSFVALHPLWPHLVVNLVILFWAGREVEPIIGRRHFACLYLLGNFLGGGVQWGAMNLGLASADSVLVGVSAGVAAVLSAYATILPELEAQILLFFFFPIRLRAKLLGVGLVIFASALWIAQAATQIGPAAILAGSAIGWIYAKCLGFGNPLAFERYLFDRRQHAARLERMPAEQFIREELDPILEKIAHGGVRGLTRAERKLLEKGRAKLAARDLPAAPVKRQPTAVR